MASPDITTIDPSDAEQSTVAEPQSILPSAEEATETTNKFQTAISAWRTLDLTSLTRTLDASASELVSHQRDSLLQRKDLAQKTKDFRKLDDGSKLNEIKDLLKAYQTYIDVLTNHNKSIHGAFMAAYTPLSEAPDPYPLLDASVDALVTAEEVVPKLRGENEELKKQLRKVTGQAEQAEKSLEEERERQQSEAGNRDTQIKEVESSWERVLKEKEDNWSAKESSLEEKIEGQDRLLKELKASYEVSQRLERSGEESQDTGRTAVSAAELEIVSAELEKTNTRLAEVEVRNEQLRVELAQSASQQNTAKVSSIEEDPAYLRLRSENSSLLRRLDSARYDRDSEKGDLEGRSRALDREVKSLKADRDALQAKVQRWSDYEEVKRELDMMRAIEFASTDDVGELDGEQDTVHANGHADKTSKGESLEQLLLSRNKKLGNDLTELRVSHNDLQDKLEQLQEELSSTNMELEKSRELNATLENDLQKTQQEASNAFDTMSVAGTYTSRYRNQTYGSRRGGAVSPTSSIVGGFDPSGSISAQGSPRGLDSLRAGPGEAGSGQGILPMVTAQRDRFKKKIAELEIELQKQYQTVSSLRTEVASLQRDNLNLYEKTRYVATYNAHSRGPATSGAAYGGNRNPSSVSIASGGDTSSGLAMDRYRSAYENDLSPFAAFRRRESTRAMKRLSLPEKSVFQVMRLVLATRTSRNLFAMYCVALHVLIFIMLYWMGTADMDKHGSALGAGVATAVGSSAEQLSHGDWEHAGFDGTS